MNTDDLISRIHPVFNTIRKIKEENDGFLNNIIIEYTDIVNTLSDKISYSDLVRFQDSLIRWINSLDKKSEVVIETTPWENFDNWFDTFLQEFSESVNAPFEDSYTPQQSGPILLKIRQFQYRMMAKRYRKRVARNAENLKGRIFNVHNYLHNLVRIEVVNFLFQNWQKMLMTVAQILDSLHKTLDEIKDKNLVSPELKKSTYWTILKSGVWDNNIDPYKTLTTSLNDIVGFYTAKSNENASEIKQKIEDRIRQTWYIAGSPLFSGTAFSFKHFEKKYKRIIRLYKKSVPKWSIHIKGFCGDWLTDVELAHLQYSIADLYFETLGIINQKITNKITPLFRDILGTIAKTDIKFKKIDAISVEDLHQLLIVENKNLVKTLQHQKLPSLIDAVTQANFDKTFQGFFNRTENQIENLSEKHIIFKDCDMQNLPPDSKNDEIPFKELLESDILRNALKQNDEIILELQDELKSVLRSFSTIDQIVEYNLEAALNLLKEKDPQQNIDKAGKIAAEGLNRTQATLKELQEKIKTSVGASSDLFSETARQMMSGVQELGDNEKILELKIRLARAKTKEKLINWRNEIWGRIKYFIPKIISYLKDVYLKARSQYSRLRKVTGLGPIVAPSGDSLTHFLITTQRKINAMPYIYQRLFRLQPLDEMRFFYGREQQLDLLREDFENFKQGFSGTTAIVAEKGNGKTTFINYAITRIFESFPIINYDCIKTIHSEGDLLQVLREIFEKPNVNSIQELENIIETENRKYICVLENIHNLFLRVIDGFEAIERFVLFVRKTRHHLFWIVTSGIYGWEYLDKVIKISNYFKQIIQLETLTEKQVQEIIFKRHLASGYGLHFLENESATTNRQYKKLTAEEDKQDYLRQVFFEKMTDISGGNIKSAMSFWLSTLELFDEEKIHVKVDFEIDHSFVYQLPSEELFTLSALIIHEYLSYEQISLIFNQDLSESELILNRLYKKGYITINGDKYSVHPFLYRPVVKALKSRNILH